MMVAFCGLTQRNDRNTLNFELKIPKAFSLTLRTCLYPLLLPSKLGSCHFIQYSWAICSHSSSLVGHLMNSFNSVSEIAPHTPGIIWFPCWSYTDNVNWCLKTTRSINYQFCECITSLAGVKFQELFAMAESSAGSSSTKTITPVSVSLGSKEQLVFFALRKS